MQFMSKYADCMLNVQMLQYSIFTMLQYVSILQCSIGPLFHWSIGPLVHWSLFEHLYIAMWVSNFLFQMKRLRRSKLLSWTKVHVVAKMIRSRIARHQSALVSFTVSKVFHVIGRFDFYTLSIIFCEDCHFAETIALAGFDLRMDANTPRHEWSN